MNTVWEVMNGYAGETAVTVLVEADTEEAAVEAASTVFYEDAHPEGRGMIYEPDYWCRDEKWSVEPVTFPYMIG